MKYFFFQATHGFWQSPMGEFEAVEKLLEWLFPLTGAEGGFNARESQAALRSFPPPLTLAAAPLLRNRP